MIEVLTHRQSPARIRRIAWWGAGLALVALAVSATSIPLQSVDRASPLAWLANLRSIVLTGLTAATASLLALVIAGCLAVWIAESERSRLANARPPSAFFSEATAELTAPGSPASPDRWLGRRIWQNWSLSNLGAAAALLVFWLALDLAYPFSFIDGRTPAWLATGLTLTLSMVGRLACLAACALLAICLIAQFSESLFLERAGEAPLDEVASSAA